MQLKGFLLREARKNVLLAIVRALYHKMLRPTSSYTVGVDALGVPIVYYRDVGLQRNPVTICNYALKYYNAKNERAFMNCVDWLVKNLHRKERFSVWEYAFPWKVYNLNPPWVSGMAQGLGIKVLVLAYKENGNEDFLRLAFDALKAFTVPVQFGGCCKLIRMMEDTGMRSMQVHLQLVRMFSMVTYLL